MAIHRGIQSAIFYYLSCAPCAEARYRKKRKQEAIRGRADREALEAELGPNVYRHPSPSSTNPYWQAEIAAGPALVSRGGKKKNASNNATSESRAGMKSSMTQRSNESGVPSSVDLSSGGASRDGRVDSKYHFQQFQREDEPWQSSVSVERLASRSALDGSLTGNGITRPQRVKLRGFEPGKNPQINELHPATVTKINSREEAKWLMAPPPTADFMSGKERGSRSCSDSGGSSRLSARSGIPLSREVSRRIMEQKMRNGDGLLTPTLSRESTIPTANDPNGQRHDRSATDEIDFALDDSPTNRAKRRPSPIQVQVSEDSTESTDTVIRKPELAPQPIRTRKVASKPQLSTIVSESISAADHESTERPKENIRHSDESIPERDRDARRSALATKDDSLQVLKELAPRSAIFKSRVLSQQDLSHADETSKRVRMPSQDVGEERRHEGGPALFDSWYTPDFMLPDWIHEHTKREVTQRWSMDI